MAYKQLGPGVSQNPQTVVSGGGAYTAEDHSWESLVFQHNSPIHDWELNLQNEICGPYGIAQHVRQTLASGFLDGDFYESGRVSQSFSFLPASVGNENSFLISASNLVVNGWGVRFEFSDTTTVGWNKINLPVPPVSGSSTNIVILEVWRALLTAGNVINKSLSGQIFRHGNAKAPDLIGNRNLVDDIVDPVYAAESQARVQIQYRYRVISSWDLEVNPEVPDNVVANTAPYYNGSDVNGNASLYSYSRLDGDPGLWRAGTGDSISASDLGTVDGYIYAIPVCAVFRRNSAPFNRSTNLNGGSLIFSGVSDRPDGIFSDQIVSGDVLDLRKSMAIDFKEILDRSYNDLLQNNLVTNHGTVGSCSGTSIFCKDLLGTGNRQPDAIRTRFSDRSLTESVVCSASVASPHLSVIFNLSSLPISWYGIVNVSSIAPVGTSVIAVSKVRIRIPSSNEEVDGLDLLNGRIYVSSMSITPSGVTLNFTKPTPITGNVEVYAELSIQYPKGVGLERNSESSFAIWMPNGSTSWVDPVYLSSLSDPNRKKLDNSLWSIDSSHRELELFLKGSSTSDVLRVSSTGTFVMLPQRLDGSPVQVNDGSNPPYMTSSYTVNTAYTQITLSYPRTPNSTVTVTYSPLRPAPPIPVTPDSTYEVFYSSLANQSLRVPFGVHEIKLRTRSLSPFLTVITAGTASPDDLAWPGLTGFSQIPLATFASDDAVDGSVSVQIPNSSPVANGYANVPLKFGFVENNEVIVKNNGDTVQDSDGRNFWPRVDNSVSFYGVSNLSASVNHKTVYPVLMEVVSCDTNLVRPGTLVLTIFTSFESGSSSFINVSTSTSSNCVAIYKVRGNMINPRKLTV